MKHSFGLLGISLAFALAAPAVAAAENKAKSRARSTSGPAVAAAEKKAKSRSRAAAPAQDPVAATPPVPPATGWCAYRSGGSSLKDCFVTRDAGEFEIRIAPGQPVSVTLDERISVVVPAEDAHVSIQLDEVDGDFTVYELTGRRLPLGWSSQLRAQTYSVTLRFVQVERDGDSQVLISRADRADRDAEVERRVEAERERLEAQYTERFEKLDTQAARLAREYTVNQIQAHFGTFDPGVRPTRHDFIVLRAEQGIQLGDRDRYLRISVQNRDRAALHMGSLAVWLEKNDAREPLEAEWTCGASTLRFDQRITCVVGLQLPQGGRPGDRVRVKVQSRDRKRSVTLGGIRLH
jgi:hypothetical protein